MNNYDTLVKSVSCIAKELHGLQAHAVAQHTPVVEAIIADRNCDVLRIQKTLDCLLDVACHPDGLQLFKTLCRYYYNIDPSTTVDYIYAYRELWEPAEADEGA